MHKQTVEPDIVDAPMAEIEYYIVVYLTDIYVVDEQTPWQATILIGLNQPWWHVWCLKSKNNGPYII